MVKRGSSCSNRFLQTLRGAIVVRRHASWRRGNGDAKHASNCCSSCCFIPHQKVSRCFCLCACGRTDGARHGRTNEAAADQPTMHCASSGQSATAFSLYTIHSGPKKNGPATFSLESFDKIYFQSHSGGASFLWVRRPRGPKHWRHFFTSYPNYPLPLVTFRLSSSILYGAESMNVEELHPVSSRNSFLYSFCSLDVWGALYGPPAGPGGARPNNPFWCIMW